MAGAKLGETALRQIQRMMEIVAERIVNRSINRFKSPIAGQGRYLGKTDAAISLGGTGTVSKYSRGETESGEDAAKGTEQDTGEDFEDCYSRYGDLEAEVWVFVEWIDGGWEVYQAGCS